MKFDISLLGDPSEREVRKLTSKAAKEIGSKHREVIESQIRSLDRVMQELISCRAKKRDVKERDLAPGFRLHSSIIEEELIAAKSNISLLNGAMNDLNMDSVSNKSSLQD